MSSAAKPTAVSRTAAGDHEIAVPSLGLSLTQRRLLTLLDRPIPAASLAERSGLPPEKFIRDLGRLARFRLVEGALPEDLVPGEAAPDTVTRAAVATPPAVTIRPAANAPSMVDRAGKHPGGTRWRMLAAAAVAAAASAFGWLHFAGEPTAGPAATLRQAPVTPAASPARLVATAKQASAAAMPAPRVETTPADRAATAAAISALRRSEARSLGPALVDGSRTTPAPPQERTAVRTEAIAREPAPRETAPRQTAHSSTATPADAAAVHPPAAAASPVAAASPARSAPATIAAGPPHETPAAPIPAPAVTVAPSQPVAAIATPPRAATASAAPPLATAAPAERAAPPTTPVTSPDVSSEALVPIARVAPDFPAEAIRRRIDSGRVRARVTVDATGRVTAVAIVSAAPRGVFDDAVSAALSRWRFPPGSAGRKALVDVDFHRD